eukprot:g13860.t1
MEKNDAEETHDVKGNALEIKEYSEASFDDDDDNDVGESKEDGTQNEASESLEEAPDFPKGPSNADEEHDRDIAQQKKNRRARAQPGAKRGGRRDTERSGWGRRFKGRKKTQFQAGDLVEAEWAGSGWWYVGYVGEGEQPAASTDEKDRKRKKEVHVIFIDGDEADVPGKDLKLLGKPGENRYTALPRHVPVADLGSGRLHGNREPPSNQHKNGEGGAKGHGSKNGRRNKDINHIYNDNDTRQEPSAIEETPHPPLPRRGSMGNVEDRIRQGTHALWGGRGAPGSGTRGTRGGGGNVSRGGGGDWWDTGTPYAFQPRLSADKTTVLSFVSTAGRRDRSVVGLDRTGGLRGKDGKGGGSSSGGDSRAVSRADSVAVGLSVQHHQQQQQLHGVHGASRELMRIVKVPESNRHHGQRVFFLA